MRDAKDKERGVNIDGDVYLNQFQPAKGKQAQVASGPSPSWKRHSQSYLDGFAEAGKPPARMMSL